GAAPKRLAVSADRAGDRSALAGRAQAHAGPSTLALRWIGGRPEHRFLPRLAGYLHARRGRCAAEAGATGSRLRPLARPALEAGRPRWRVNIGGRVCRLKPGKGGRDGREGDLLVGFAVSLPRPEARDGAPSHGTGRGAVPPAPPPPRPPAV